MEGFGVGCCGSCEVRVWNESVRWMLESSVGFAASLYLSKPRSTSSHLDHQHQPNNISPTRQTNKQADKQPDDGHDAEPASIHEPSPIPRIQLHCTSPAVLPWSRKDTKHETCKRNLGRHLHHAMLQLPCQRQRIHPRWSAGVRGTRHNASSGGPDMCRGNPSIHANQRATSRRHRNAHRELGI
jgi:hypothetical protein